MSVVTENQITRDYLSTDTTGASTESTGSYEISKEQFLQLLVAQMEYQDPLNPMENTEFTSQLAQFSSLEQLYNLNDGFENLQLLLSAQTSFQAIDLIGKSVKASGQFIGVNDGAITTGSFELPEYSSQTTVNIYDLNYNLIKSIDLSSQAAGRHEVDWDGTDSQGQEVSNGVYFFEVAAQNQSGETISVSSYMEGEITGVTFASNGAPILILNGLEIELADVIEIMKTATGTEN